MGRYEIEANSGPGKAERRRHVRNLVTARYRSTRSSADVIKVVRFESQSICWASATTLEMKSSRVIVVSDTCCVEKWSTGHSVINVFPSKQQVILMKLMAIRNDMRNCLHLKEVQTTKLPPVFKEEDTHPPSSRSAHPTTITRLTLGVTSEGPSLHRLIPDCIPAEGRAMGKWCA